MSPLPPGNAAGPARPPRLGSSPSASTALIRATGWSAFQPGTGDQVEGARNQALHALKRLRTDPDLTAYRWVLVTW